MISLRNFIVPTDIKTVYVQRFASLQAVLCLACIVELQGKRIALLLATRILHHGAEALVRGFGHADSELKRVVAEIAQGVAFRHLQLLRYRQRTREVDAQLAVVAQVGSNLARANPLRVQHVIGGSRGVVVFRFVQVVEVGQSSSAGLEVGTLVVHPDGALDSLGISAVKSYDLLLFLHGTATRIRHFVVRVPVPIGITRNHLMGALSARFIGIDRRVAREVIVDVVV